VKVHLNASEFNSDAPVVLTVGTFDGVHIGHRAVIDLLTLRAKELGGESVLLTFHPHPRTVLHPEQHQLKLLNTIEERKALLRDAGSSPKKSSLDTIIGLVEIEKVHLSRSPIWGKSSDSV
jgi:riboflavin kinase/FMN adenylyltransferase